MVNASELRQLIIEIWTEVLGAEGFGPDSGFFAVGGDSLAAVQIPGELSARLGLDDDAAGRLLVELFSGPTPDRLAQWLMLDRASEAPQRSVASGSAPRIERP